jgi:hypothetical protein
MKRKRTELEEDLIKKGYKLLYKTYSGKHSQKVDHYVYGGSTYISFDSGGRFVVPTKILLNPGRTQIFYVQILNCFEEYIGSLTVETIVATFNKVNDYVMNQIKEEQLSANEVVEVLESIENE